MARGILASLCLVIIASVPATSAAETNHAWVSRHGAVDGEEAYDVAVSPDGSRVFVTGSAEPAIDPVRRGGQYWATTAFDAETGNQLWVRERDGALGDDDFAYSVATTWDGSTVLVGGVVAEHDLGDAAIVAYDAATGAVRWESVFDGPLERTAELFDAIAVTPDDSSVIAVGYADTTSPSIPGWFIGLDLLVASFDVQTGELRWQFQHDGSGHDLDNGLDVTLSRDGSLAAIVAQSWGSDGGMNALTVLVNADSGNVVWTHERDYADDDVPLTALFSPDGSAVYVGGTIGLMEQEPFVQRHDSTTGRIEWARRLQGWYLGEGPIALSQDGDLLYATAERDGDWVVAALRSVDGSIVWETNAGVRGSPRALTSLSNGTVIVTGNIRNEMGFRYNIATIAFSASDGSPIWAGTYDGGNEDTAWALGMSADDRRVFSVGTSWREGTNDDYIVVSHGPGCADGSREEGIVSRPLDILLEPLTPSLHDVNCKLFVPSGL